MLPAVLANPSRETRILSQDLRGRFVDCGERISKFFVPAKFEKQGSDLHDVRHSQIRRSNNRLAVEKGAFLGSEIIDDELAFEFRNSAVLWGDVGRLRTDLASALATDREWNPSQRNRFAAMGTGEGEE